MDGPRKTRRQLLEDLEILRRRIKELEKLKPSRLRLKTELSRQERCFQDILDTVNVGLYRNTAGPKGRFVEANPALMKIFGYKSKAELLKVNVSDFYRHPSDRRRFSEKLKAQGFIRQERLELKKRDGTPIFCSVSAVAVKDAKGRVRYFDGIIEDRTDQIKAEEALRRSEARFRSIIEASPMGIHLYELRSNNRLVFVGANRAADKILNVDNSQFIGMTIEKAFPSLAGTEIPKHYREAAEMGKSWHTEQLLYEDHKINGAYEVYAFQTSPGRMAAMFLDITEHKQTEEALRESEVKYRAIFESFHDVYYRTDRQGLVTIISPSVRIQAGYAPEDVIGRPVTDFYLDPDEREEFNKSLKQNGMVNDYELQLLAKDGRVIEVSASSKLIFDASGNPVGVEGVLRDITDRKKAEERLRASLKEKEVLLQEIHHRVKNNMQIISSLINLQSQKVKSPEMKAMLHKSRDRIRAMALIHEKLYQSHDLAKVNLGQYIDSLTVHLYHIYSVDSMDVRLDLQLEDVLLDINTAIPCGLLINELVSNALKHAFPDGHNGFIRLEVSSGQNGRRCLTVEDNGVGLPAGFDVANPQTLGMQLVNDLVEQIGGSLLVDTREGTYFSVTF
jgi:PAS domain S-box-containing protein